MEHTGRSTIMGLDGASMSSADAGSPVTSVNVGVQRDLGRSDACKNHRQELIPLSYAQERLWFLEQLGLVGAAYNVSIALRLKGDFDSAVMSRCLSEVVRRHEALRTRFFVANGVPYQHIDGPYEIELRHEDLSRQSDGDLREIELRKCMETEQSRQFDLESGPLLRVALVKLSRDEQVMLLTMHHIISDGWSLRVLCYELSVLYGAYSQGRSSPLKELPLQYADYAIWQRERSRENALEAQLRYWKERLHAAPPQLELPTDRPRPAVESFRGSEVPLELPARVVRAVKELARREGGTPFMVFLTAYQVLLSRWSGQEDIVVGSPVAGRMTADTEGLIGFFVNTLVLRTDVSASLTFRQLLARVRDASLDAYANQDLPFEALVKELRPDRSLSRQPIFQVVLALDSFGEEHLELPGLTWTWSRVARVATHFDLTLHLHASSDRLYGVLEYATDLFDRETIERFSSNFQGWLEQMLGSPDTPVGRLPMLTTAERTQILNGFNDGAAFPSERLIHDLFDDQVARTPDATAVVCEGRALTYAELHRQATDLAEWLIVEKAQPDQFVAVFCERSLEMVVGIIAILKASAAYLPLDPSNPVERISYVLSDAAPKFILTQGHLRGRLPPTDARVIALDDDWPRIDEAAESGNVQRAPALSPRNIAYVIYTSGSTGKPKGVMVEHRNVVRLFAATEKSMRFSENDVWTLFHSIAFDFSVWEIWGALLYGGRLVVVPYLTARSPREFYCLLCKEHVTILNQTPSAFAQLIQSSTDAIEHSLRMVIFGGEALDPQILVPWVLRNGAERPSLVNMYGITETTVHVTQKVLTAAEIEANRRSVIGRPIPDLRIYLLNQKMEPVPIGVVAELYVSGHGLSRGYLNRPGLTSERYLPDLHGDAGNRMYRTGDVGKWRPDGSIEYLGRNDHQVKVRGYRIELGEIEAKLLSHAQVEAAAVIAQESEVGEKSLVAYVNAMNSTADDVSLCASLRSHLSAELPDYMVPSVIVPMREWPLTANGKLDRRALPRPTVDLYRGGHYDAPQGDAETVVANVWQELLNLERVGRNDNFFAIGGHSLLVVKAVFHINRLLGSALTVKDVYSCPSIVGLAQRIRGTAQEDDLIDLAQEATLDEGIVAREGVRRIPARAILLTGGTGFVGRFLLYQLLQDAHATVYCLVRGARDRSLSRLKSVLKRWELWRDEFESRVVAVPGDLSSPRLGIDHQTYEVLSNTIDSIYHCATSMNHLETYQMAKLENVESARELLRFATDRKPKVTNYISTLSVFRPTRACVGRVVNEESAIDLEEHRTSGGYAASKWVAERIFMTASERGIPCNIFRLGLVWADSRHGRYDDLQREYMMYKSSVLLGAGITDYKYETIPTPVDYVARAITYLASRHEQGGGVFHIASPEPMLRGLFEHYNDVSEAPIHLLSHYDWICEIKRLHHGGQSLPAVPLLEFAFSMDERAFVEHRNRIHSERIQLKCERTYTELLQGGIIPPRISNDVLRAIIECRYSEDITLRASRVGHEVRAVRRTI